jgi:hypothetical protein
MGGIAEMASLFRAISRDRGFPIGYSDRISHLIPEPIAKLPCFLDQLTGIWRYEYGEPIILDGGSTLVGTPMFPEVERLLDVLGCASWRLPAEKLQGYLLRLADRRKHEDTLIEFAPILRLSADVKVEHEVRGTGGGNTTVDWRIGAPEQPTLLLEVKNRVRDLIESFEAIKRRDKDGPVPEPQHDHRLLFKSVTHKFKPAESSDIIHGVWIKTGIKQEEEDLRTAFEDLPPGHIHVVVLGSWDEDAYVLASNAPTRRRVLRVLRLRQSGALVFKRSSRFDRTHADLKPSI